MHYPRAFTLLFLTLSFLGATAAAARQDAKPASPAPAAEAAEWIDDQKLQQTLMEGAVALIDADRAPEVSEIAEGLATPACELDLPDHTAQAAEPPAAGHAAPAKARVESEALYEQARQSVVVVGSAYKCERCTNWHVNGATGFMLTADGALVTNYHVVDQADKRALVAMTGDGRVFPVIEALAGDEETDVAILRVEPVDQHGEKATFAPARLAEKSRVGQNVRVIHHADGRYYTLTEGIVSRRYTDRHRGGSRWMTIPADLKKDAAALDLAISLGMLRCTGSIIGDELRKYLVAGELMLDGRVRKIRGGLSMALLAQEKRHEGVIVPADNAREAAVVEGLRVIPVKTLQEAVSFLNGEDDGVLPYSLNGDAHALSELEPELDFADVRGQEAVKRALTIAAAGGHNICMIGPPGSGKSMLAKRLGFILPPLSRKESLETTRIYSAVGKLPPGVSLLDRRPVRSPHHSATAQALVGGGSIPRPGECSLAHNGILFLDELPEFGRGVLDMLREPLEGGEITVSRVHGSTCFPADFMLVAAMNPTHAGGGNPVDGKRDGYLSRLSGPLLDRIDLHIEVPAVQFHEMSSRQRGTDSTMMRQQVSAARERQLARFGDPAMTNARMDSKKLGKFVQLSDAALLVMKQAMQELGLSARAYDKVRRVARTVADIDGSDDVTELHVAEAVGYRLLDRKF